jgi:hypothetical protein
MTDSITVIIPTRDRPEYLRVCVASVLASASEAQRRYGVRTRVLVVEDAPVIDSGAQVCRDLGVDYLRIAQHDGLADPGAAILLGVQNVDTTYQCIFGDDDVMLPRHLSAGYAMLSEGYDVVSCSYQVTDEDLVPLGTVKLEESDLGDLIAGYTGVNDGSFVSHELVKDLDWDVTLEGQMLVPIWGELMMAGRKSGVVETPTWYYRRHTANISLGALTPRDRVLRGVAQARLRKRALEVLGYVPKSPRAEEAALEWAAWQKILNPTRSAMAGAFVRRQLARLQALIRRARNKTARVIAP